MTDQQHPITPSPELVEQWNQEWLDATYLHGRDNYIATQAARWGADQELEACVEWVSQWCCRWPDGTRPEDELRAARRPKPTSLKEQALQAWADVEAGTDDQTAMAVIRRALEQLDD